jgi:curli biogenesis system outer membrane secretion channel CsgG
MSHVLRRSLLALTLLIGFRAFGQHTDYLATGRAQLKGTDSLSARDSAMAAARRKAVERAILDVAGSVVLEQNQEAITENIYPNDAAYVTKTTVVNEGQDGDAYRVSIRATVDMKALKRDLQALGAASRGPAYRPRVMVLIDEYFGTDSTPRDRPTLSKEVTVEDSKGHEAGLLKASGSASVAGAASASSGSERGSAAVSGSAAHRVAAAYVKDEAHFALSIREYFPDSAQVALPDSAAAAEVSSLLLKEDFNLVDRATVQKLREEELGPNGYMVNYLRDNTNVARAARTASQKYGADYLLIGACNVVYRGVGEDQQHISGANLVLKVVNASTGQIVAAVTNSEPGMSGDAQSSRFVAAKRVGTTVGESLVAQLLDEVRNRERAGIEIDVKLYGVPDLSTKVAFGGVLEAVDGVQGVEERSYDRTNQRVEYQVTFRGSVTQFKNSLFKKALAEKRWKTLDEQVSTGNNVNLILKGSK